MLLTGSYRRSLDDKLRLPIPKPIRERLQDSDLFITAGTDNALVVYTESILQEIGHSLGKLSPAAKEARAFSRMFYAQTQPLDVDKQGRIRIPPELAKIAEFETEVVIVGVRDRLEIWNADSWEDFLEATQPSFDELAEKVFGQANAAGERPTTN